MTATTVSAPEGLRVIKIDPAFSMGEIECCILTVWRLQPSSEAFELRHRELQDLAVRHRGSCAYMELIEPTSAPPTDELRKIAVDVFRKLGKDVSCVGFVLDGQQLRTTLARAILTGMMFLLPQMQPSKVFKRIAECANWVQPKIGNTNPEFETRILRTFDYLRNYSST